MRQSVYSWAGGTPGVPGYGSAFVGGPFAVSFPGHHLIVNGGTVPQCPGGPLLYLDVSPAGHIIGQGQNDDRVWLWNGSAWGMLDLAYGPHASIFTPDGLPLYTTGWEQYGHTMGWRYCYTAGQPVSCLSTYSDPARGLYEWTEWPDIAIGQGGNDIGEGAVVRFSDDGVLRRLAFEQLRDHGQLRNVIVKRSGDVFAIVVVDYDALLTTITEATLAELRALPAVQPIPPEPIPPDPPDPIPPDPPEPEPPDPVPPDPIPPEPPTPHPEVSMLAAYGPIMPGFAPGTEHDNGNGTVSVQKPNGKWLCCTPDGHLEERDTPGGVWESFKKGPGCLVAERDGGDKGPLVYVLGAAETT